MNPLMNPIRTLTADERAALGLSATGLGAAEVADARGRAPEEVRSLLASSIARLGARSKLEAVLIAARTGQLDALT
jgi:DNA-binding CsgD family transcriptional regulator